MDPIANGFDHVPPIQVHAPPMPGYYRPMMQPPYNVHMAPMHPPQMGMAVGMGMGMPPGFYQPQTVFPIPQWIPFVGPRMGQHQAAAAVDGGAAFGAGQAHRTPDLSLNARADDILKDTLKKGKELGLSQREVLEHLQSKYSGINWTAYFLENAVLPGSKSDTATRSVPSSCAATSGSQATTSADEPAQKKRRTTTRNPTGRPRGRPRGRKVPAFQPNVPSSSRDDQSVAPSLSTASSSTRASTDRPKRGGKLDEFHHETYIPPFDKSSKPVVPRRDPGDDLNRFSTEEKIFFVHYLKWRLREGRLPSKVTLLAELAKELPHHDAEAWKKHWNKDAMLPDDIYSAARKRAIDEELFSSDSDTASTLTPAPETDDEYRPSSPRQGSPVPPPLAPSIPSAVNQKVTEDDLRAMALYMVEKRDVWAQYKTRSHRWEEFSRRKENLKRRSHGGWCNVEWRHAAEIRKLYEEYLVEKQDSEMEDERDEGLTRSLVYPTEHIEEPAARAAESSGFVNVKVKREYIEVDSD